MPAIPDAFTIFILSIKKAINIMPPSIGLFRDIVIGTVNMWDDLVFIAILNEYSELLDRLANGILFEPINDGFSAELVMFKD